MFAALRLTSPIVQGSAPLEKASRGYSQYEGRRDQKLKEYQQIWISSAIRQLMMNLECGRALTILTLCARTVRDLPLTNIAEKHAVVASLSGTPIQLRTLGRPVIPVTERILLEHTTCNEIYVECNHGNARDASCFRKTI